MVYHGRSGHKVFPNTLLEQEYEDNRAAQLRDETENLERKSMNVRVAELEALQEELNIASIDPNNGARVRLRCQRTEHLLRAAIVVLETNPDDYTVENLARYVQQKLNVAIGEFGLKVVLKAS